MPRSTARLDAGRRLASWTTAAPLGAAATAALVLASAAPAAAQADHVAHAFGDSAANVPLDSSSKQVMTRWVARQTGRLETLQIQIKVNNTTCLGGSSGYASGTSGRLRATTYAVRADGRPDLARELARDEFVPCNRYAAGTAAIQVGIDVTRGAEYATVVQNVDSSPGSNWFSQNFLYHFDGLTGANARNERDPTATDAHYGLDPREIVGYSTNGGGSWSLPGGPYGPGGKAFLPTFVQQYAGGGGDGQPYYYPRGHSSSATSVFPNVPENWTIKRLGLYTSSSGSGTIVLDVNGAERARASVSGDGLLSASIAPVDVAPGSTVTVSVSGSVSVPQLSSEKPWEDLIGLSSGHRHFDQSNPRMAVPVFAIPMYASAVPRPPDSFKVDPAARSCLTRPAAVGRAGKKGKVRFTRRQVRTNQRVYAAGIRRAIAIEKWLNDGIVASDLCGGALGADLFSSGVTTGVGVAQDLSEPSPRKLVIPGAKAKKKGAKVRLDRRSLVINRRIALALRARARALEARMDGRLTGGDLAPGTLGVDALNAGLRITAASDEPSPEASVTKVAKLPKRIRVKRSAATLRSNQRIASDAIRRLNRLRDRIEGGLTGEEFAPGSITRSSVDPEIVG